MSYYDSFDCKVNCEELIEVTPEEQEEVFALIAQENEAKIGFSHWLDSLEESERAAYLEQQAFEQKEAKRKDYLRGYSNQDDSPTYGGIAI